ncbi:MAG TPA: hypothetical protein VHK27_09645 [Gammaproteobacteria bacterium]|nr:hypothetical protein [Gammaproteobacteria bacterium]
MTKEPYRRYITRSDHITHSKGKSRASTFIQVDEDFGIGVDSHTWHILKRHRYKATERWESILWYATFEQRVHGPWQRAVQTCGGKT